MTTTTSPSTTYPYTYTTFTNASPASFTTPTAIPSMFPWGPVPSFACSASPSASPSSSPDGPLDLPQSPSGSCAISNIENVNDHAFWDMYDCCKSGKMSAVGSPLPCSAVCYTDDQQTFLELGECLAKRAKEVVCSPPEAQRGEPKSSGSSSVESTSSKVPSKTADLSQVTGTKAPTDTPSATPTQANSAAGQVAVSKAGFMVFGVLALTSALGMLV